MMARYWATALRSACTLTLLFAGAVPATAEIAIDDEAFGQRWANADLTSDRAERNSSRTERILSDPAEIDEILDSACECDDCCCDDCCCGDEKLLGVFAPSDHAFDDFISPVTNPVFFEDPRTLTEARFIFVNNTLPPGLGRVQLYALQIRAALTERLSIIATKDGFIVGENGIPHQDGWADVAAGLKYNFYRDPNRGRLLSAGLVFELPVGSTRALQGNGDGEFDLFLAGGMRLGESMHWISTTGFRLPTDTSVEDQVWYWSNHLDRQLMRGLYVFAETNWFHWMDSGNVGGPLVGLGGLDLYNFGTSGMAGHNVVTGAIGLKVKPRPGMEIGVAWEAPLSPRHDVIDNRLTVDWILRY